MLTSILYGFTIWFNVGLASQVILTTFDGLLNRRWPYHWADAYNYFLAGMFGFISAFNCYLFMIGFAIDPDSFVTEEDEGDLELPQELQDADEQEIMVIAGLTKEEQEGVLTYVNGLLEARAPEEEKKDV